MFVQPRLLLNAMEFLVAEVAVKILCCSVVDYELFSMEAELGILLLSGEWMYLAFYLINDCLNCSGMMVERVHPQVLLLEELLQFQ